MIVRNLQKRDHFRSAWTREKGYLVEKIARGTKAPEKPGQGWLQGEAAHKDLCIALFKDVADNPVVCGNSTSSDNYYCDSCQELLHKIETKQVIEDMPA